MLVAPPSHGLKTCRNCQCSKSRERFAIDAKTRDGRSTKCKECMKEYAQRRYERLRKEAGKRYRKLIRDEQWQMIAVRGRLVCRTCGVEQPLDAFRFSLRAPRRRRMCRKCERKRCANRRAARPAEYRASTLAYRCKQYGITPEEYNRLLAVQDNRCAICEEPLGEVRQTIDHCHATERVRGIVHSNCNLMLGNSREQIHVLCGAIRYLIRHQSISFGSTAYVDAAREKGSMS